MNGEVREPARGGWEAAVLRSFDNVVLGAARFNADCAEHAEYAEMSSVGTRNAGRQASGYAKCKEK